MLDLVKKEHLTKEELSRLDTYLSLNVEAMVTVLDNKDIIRIIDLIKHEFIISKFHDSLICHLNFEDLYALFINEEDIEYYLKLYELEKSFDYDYAYLGLGIANYYYRQEEKAKALSLYQEVFKVGYDVSNVTYFESIERYLELLNVNPVDTLIELIDGFPSKDTHGNDLINTYLLLLSKLNKAGEEYLKYINEALPLSLAIVREYQKGDNERDYLSDSDEERNLCELLCLKFEYFVNKKEYVTAFELYKELTREIAKSGCVRYYHARDKYYKEMLKLMSEEYSEMTFLIDFSFKTFEIQEKINNINEMLNKEITLVNENKQTYKFKVIDVYKNEVIIVPILPLIGEGGKMYTDFIIQDNKFYLEHNHR